MFCTKIYFFWSRSRSEPCFYGWSRSQKKISGAEEKWLGSATLVFRSRSEIRFLKWSRSRYFLPGAGVDSPQGCRQWLKEISPNSDLWKIPYKCKSNGPPGAAWCLDTTVAAGILVTTASTLFPPPAARVVDLHTEKEYRFMLAKLEPPTFGWGGSKSPLQTGGSDFASGSKYKNKRFFTVVCGQG